MTANKRQLRLHEAKMRTAAIATDSQVVTTASGRSTCRAITNLDASLADIMAMRIEIVLACIHITTLGRRKRREKSPC